MSSLVKYSRVIPKKESARIIDSNERVAAKLAELAAVSDYINQEDADNDFVSGIDAEHVELLLKDEEEPEEQVTPEDILAEAKEEATKIQAQAQAEKEFLFDRARKEGNQQGYQEGYQRAMAEFDAQKKALEQEKASLEAEYKLKCEELEPVMVDKILELVEHVLHIDLSGKKLVILQLLEASLSQMERSKEYLVRVSKEDYEALRGNQEAVRELLPEDAQVSIVEDSSLQIHQCMVETDRGIFDCSLDTQWNSLKRTIQMVSLT